MNRRSFLRCSVLPTALLPSSQERTRRPYRQAWPTHRELLLTGLDSLDELLCGGVPSGEVTLLATSPWRMTFETLGFNIIDHHLTSSTAPIVFVSASWCRPSVVWFLAGIRSGVDRCKARHGHWADAAERHRYEVARQAIQSSSLHYESIRRLRFLGDLERSLIRLHRHRPIRIIVIDDVTGLKDIRCAPERGRGAARVGRRLRGLARSLGVPIVAGCPLECVTEERPPIGHPPFLHPGYCSPVQEDLGSLVPLLDSCGACLMAYQYIQFEKRNWRIGIRAAFHPRASTDSESCHTIDRLTGRVTWGA